MLQNSELYIQADLSIVRFPNEICITIKTVFKIQPNPKKPITFSYVVVYQNKVFLIQEYSFSKLRVSTEHDAYVGRMDGQTDG